MTAVILRSPNRRRRGQRAPFTQVNSPAAVAVGRRPRGVGVAEVRAVAAVPMTPNRTP